MINKLANSAGRILNAISRAVAYLRSVAGSRLAAKPRESQITPYIEPRRLTITEQWNRLAEIIRTAAWRAEEATRCQTAAALQLDLAQYGLTTLVDELSAVMDMQGRRRRATVHVLGIAPPRTLGDAIAA
jgi:hypothetical protein